MSGVIDGLLDAVLVRGEGGTALGVLHAPDAARAAARAELGLPVDRPIVLAGHQAEIWHAGIAAKLVAAHELARRYDAALVWLVPDQDVNEPTLLSYPAQTHEGRLKRSAWQIDPGAFARPGTPTGCRPPLAPGPTPRVARTEWPHEIARDGLERIGLALARQSGGHSLARQFAHAALELAHDLFGVRVDHVVLASELARGAAFAMWAERMHREARACVLSYNAASQASPDAQVRPLSMGPRWELPLWSLTPGAPRAAVYADASLPQNVAPRALAMTGFARTLLCDAWVMGLGGERYDHVTRRWLSAWMGTAPLAPGIVASATLRLPLREGPTPDPARAAASAWRVHHARHHPRLLGDDDRQRERDALVRRIADAPRGSSERRRLFAALRDVLNAARSQAAPEIDSLQRKALDEHERLRDMDCVLDRTWPFALHDAGALRAMSERVRSAVGALA